MALNLVSSTYNEKDVALQEREIFPAPSDGGEKRIEVSSQFQKPGSLRSESTSRNSSSSRSNPRIMAKRWDPWLSVETRGRKESTLKAEAFAAATLAKEMARADSSLGLISVAVGRPAPEFYPWLSMTPGDLSNEARDISRRVSNRSIPNRDSATGSISDYMPYSIGVAFDYGETPGAPALLRWIRDFTQMVHSPQYEDWSCCLTAGTTAAFEPVLRMLCERGDVLLTEACTYAGASEAARPLGLELLGIAMDEQGIVPSELDATLSAWDAQAQSQDLKDDNNMDSKYDRLKRLTQTCRKPFVLYTIPSGQNPTGATQSAQRRREIYAVAEKHDICILEDDPYYFLRLGSSTNDESQPGRGEFLRSLPPSFLSLDTCGRVLRLESASKVLAPGLRLGWLAGSAQLIKQFLHGAEFSGASPPAGSSQLMLHQLLVETWGHAGFVEWLANLSARYTRRASIMLGACDRHLPKHLCTWTAPEAGMFVWVKVAIPEGVQSKVLEDDIFKRAMKFGSLVCKGGWFAVNETVQDVALRLTFVAAAESELEAAVERLGRAISAVLEGSVEM